MAFYSGFNGRLKIGSTYYKMDKWELDSNADLFEVTNFESPSSGGNHYKEFLTSFVGATLSCSGPFDPTQGAVQTGSATFELTIGSTYKFTVPAFVNKAKYTQDAHGAARVEVSAQTTGAFNADLA